MADSNPTPSSDPQSISRRKFLNTVINAMGVAITAVIAVPVTGYFLDPVLKQAARKTDWIKLTSAANLTEAPTAYLVTAEKADGFMKQQIRKNVFAFLENGQPVALSNTCTHLGCPVSWSPEHQQYLCPCHGGVYDKSGKNIAGPPPRPLPRYVTKVEGGDLYIQLT